MRSRPLAQNLRVISPASYRVSGLVTLMQGVVEQFRRSLQNLDRMEELFNTLMD